MVRIAPFELNDTLWGKAEVLQHREEIIELRDHALLANDFHDAVLLSLTTGLLLKLADHLEER